MDTNRAINQFRTYCKVKKIKWYTPHFAPRCYKKCGLKNCKPLHESCRLDQCIWHQLEFLLYQNIPSPMKPHYKPMGVMFIMFCDDAKKKISLNNFECN